MASGELTKSFSRVLSPARWVSVNNMFLKVRDYKIERQNQSRGMYQVKLVCNSRGIDTVIKAQPS